jgi:hypothetical protein
MLLYFIPDLQAAHENSICLVPDKCHLIVRLLAVLFGFSGALSLNRLDGHIDLHVFDGLHIRRVFLVLIPVEGNSKLIQF